VSTSFFSLRTWRRVYSLQPPHHGVIKAHRLCVSLNSRRARTMVWVCSSLSFLLQTHAMVRRLTKVCSTRCSSSLSLTHTLSLSPSLSLLLGSRGVGFRDTRHGVIKAQRLCVSLNSRRARTMAWVCSTKWSSSRLDEPPVSSPNGPWLGLWV